MPKLKKPYVLGQVIGTFGANANNYTKATIRSKNNVVCVCLETAAGTGCRVIDAWQLKSLLDGHASFPFTKEPKFDFDDWRNFAETQGDLTAAGITNGTLSAGPDIAGNVSAYFPEVGLADPVTVEAAYDAYFDGAEKHPMVQKFYIYVKYLKGVLNENGIKHKPLILN
jgi:hypothetical protein